MYVGMYTVFEAKSTDSGRVAKFLATSDKEGWWNIIWATFAFKPQLFDGTTDLGWRKVDNSKLAVGRFEHLAAVP
jgi:hypothetical protein